MQQRAAVFALIGFVLLGAAGYFVYVRVTELETQVANLDRQVTQTERELQQAEASANAASRAAIAAEGRAEAAQGEAAAATVRAEDALARAEQADQEARLATADRAAALEARDVAEREAVVAVAEGEAAELEAQRARGAEAAAREEAREARQEAEAIRKQREVEMNRMQEAFSKIVETRRTAIGIVLNLGSDRIEFEFDQSELRPDERELLARISGVLIASADQGYAIQVFGHTDDVGTAAYNQGLSERRAAAVRDYLVGAGVQPDIISMQGLGKAMPLVADTTEAARTRNRRVEIAIIDTLIDFRGRR